MTILVIGASSFLAQSLQNLVKNDSKYCFLGYRDSSNLNKWPESVSCVVNFACDPVVREGKYSDFDHQCAKHAMTKGAHYIALSSRTVYGRSSEHQTYTENSNFGDDVTPYGAAKRLIETDLLENFDSITILRPSNVFGFEYSPSNLRATFFGAMLKSLKEEGYITLDIAGTTERDFLPVDILAQYIRQIVEQPQTGIFNIGSNIAIPLKNIAEAVIEGYGSGEVKVTSMDQYDGFALNTEKARLAFDIRPITKQQILDECLKIGRQLKAV